MPMISNRTSVWELYGPCIHALTEIPQDPSSLPKTKPTRSQTKNETFSKPLKPYKPSLEQNPRRTEPQAVSQLALGPTPGASLRTVIQSLFRHIARMQAAVGLHRAGTRNSQGSSEAFVNALIPMLRRDAQGYCRQKGPLFQVLARTRDGRQIGSHLGEAVVPNQGPSCGLHYGMHGLTQFWHRSC